MDENFLSALKRENKLLKECLWAFVSVISKNQVTCDKAAFFESIFTDVKEIISCLGISENITLLNGPDKKDYQQKEYVTINDESIKSNVICEKNEQDEEFTPFNNEDSSSVREDNNNILSISEVREIEHFPKLCISCQKLAEDPRSLDSHFVRCCQGGQTSCGICLSRFSRRKDLLAHVISLHKLSDIICFTCFETFADDDSYVQHQTAHEEPILRCGKCLDDVTYPTRDLFMSHLRNHPLLVCGLCSENLLNMAGLQHHLERKHHVKICGREQYRENSCDTCLIQLPSAEALQEHLGSAAHLRAVQTSIKQGSCPYCGKSYPGRLQLFMHMKKDHRKEGKKIYFCPHCDHASSKMSVLLTHTQLHFSLRSVMCDQCGAAFYDKHSYRKHCAYKHSEERPFSCDVCGLRCKMKALVKKHMVTHITERDLICHICGADFKAQPQLRKHMANVHGLTPDKISLKRVKLVDVPDELQYSKGGKASYGELRPLKYLEKEQQSVRRRKRRKSLRNREYLQKLHANTPQEKLDG